MTIVVWYILFSGYGLSIVETIYSVAVTISSVAAVVISSVHGVDNTISSVAVKAGGM